MTSSQTPARHAGTARLYAAFWEHARGARGRLAAAATLLTLSQAVKLVVPWLAAQAINKIQTGGTADLADSAQLVGLIFLAYVVSWTMHGPGRIIERSVGIRVRRNIADRLYAHLTALPLAWHEQHHSGETVRRVEKTSGALYEFAQNQFIYLQSLVNLVGPVVALGLLSLGTGGMALAGFVLIGILIIRFDRALMVLAERENEGERRYSAALIDFLGNISTVVALRLQAASRRLVGHRLDVVFEPLRRSIVLTESKWCAVDLLTIGLTWGLVAEYAWNAHGAGQALLLGNVFMLYQYANQAGGVIGSIASNYQQFARMKVDYASADAIFAAAERPPAARGVPVDWRTITLKSVEFRYAAARGKVAGLAGIGLTLARGERVALIGPSGSGKSTLLRVLAGLYDADRGQFIIDGTPHVGMRSLGSITTLIPQEAEVFEATVRENLTLGAEHRDAEIETAMEASQLAPVVHGMPRGLDTVVSERGGNLSGGQRQRLALARGVLAANASSLVLLDEPTSSLDPMSEARILDRLDAAFPDATVVASVHRLQLLDRFDRVVLMQDGRILAAGTPEELRAHPLFARMLDDSAGSSRRAA